MKNITPIEVGDLVLSDELFTADQISNDLLTDFVRRSGDENIGNLHLSGNFAVGRGNIQYSDGCINVGISCSTGSNLYRIISSDSQANTVKLTETVGLEVGMRVAIQHFEVCEECGHITEIDISSSTVTLEKVPDHRRTDEHLNDPYLLEHGDPNYTENEHALSAHATGGQTFNPNIYYNSLIAIGRPDLGTVKNVLKYGTAIGYSCMAQQMLAFATGNETLAAGKYSHAEGTETSAVGYNSHAEGWSTFAIGHDSHAEGNHTSAMFY